MLAFGPSHFELGRVRCRGGQGVEAQATLRRSLDIFNHTEAKPAAARVQRWLDRIAASNPPSI